MPYWAITGMEPMVRVELFFLTGMVKSGLIFILQTGYPAGIGKKYLPLLRKLKTACGPPEKEDVKLLFQRLYMLGQAGLREEKNLRSPGEAAVIGKYHKFLQIVYIHEISYLFLFGIYYILFRIAWQSVFLL